MPNSSRTAILSHKQDLFEAWTATMLHHEAVRAEPEARERLISQCATFTDRFLAAWAEDLPLDAPPWKEVLETLGDIAHTRAELGFGPGETADFVFGLKRALTQYWERPGGENIVAELTRLDRFIQSAVVQTFDRYSRSREDLILRQAQSLQELSCPVIKIWDGILLCVVIGTIDSARSQDLIEAILAGIKNQDARVAIIDITGVSVIDTKVLQHLFNIVRGIRFMGAEVIITGVSTAVAITVTKLHVDLSSVRSRGTLRQGLREALSLVGTGGSTSLPTTTALERAGSARLIP